MHLQPVPHKGQFSLRFSSLAIIYAPVLLILAVTLWARFQADVPISFFSRDPTATLDGHPLTGIQSTLGVLVWCAAAGICFFTSVVLRRVQADKRFCSFLLWSGAISSVMALDDMFLVHEDLAKRYLLLGENVVFLAYAFLLVWYVIKFRRYILDSEYLLLLLAFALFGSSIGIDFFQSQWSLPGRIFVEGALKLLGITTWSSYLIRTCFDAVAAQINLGPEPQTLLQNRAEANGPVPIKTCLGRDQASGLGIPSV
jgi:hypothetical protein